MGQKLSLEIVITIFKTLKNRLHYCHSALIISKL